MDQRSIRETGGIEDAGGAGEAGEKKTTDY